jgi:hypothetical protein
MKMIYTWVTYFKNSRSLNISFVLEKDVHTPMFTKCVSCNCTFWVLRFSHTGNLASDYKVI